MKPERGKEKTNNNSKAPPREDSGSYRTRRIPSDTRLTSFLDNSFSSLSVYTPVPLKGTFTFGVTGSVLVS